MSGFRGKYKNKRDANEPEIVATLRAHGCSVKRLDVPADLLIGYKGRTFLAEVKMEGAKLSAAQVQFFQDWRGNKLVLRSIEDVRDWIKQINGEG